VINNILFGSTKAPGGAYNLACSEQLNLPEFLAVVSVEVSSQLGTEKKLEFPLIENEYCKKFFPSVNGGPLNCTKARTQLSFMPTTLKAALSESIRFCLESVGNPDYKDDIAEMLEELKDDLSDEHMDSAIAVDEFFHYKLM